MVFLLRAANAIASMYLGFTQLALRCLRQSGTSFFSFVFFALVERKKDKHMVEKYHAAVGKNASL
jgi:hypothetical protein